MVEGPLHNLPSLPSSEVITYSTNISCLSDKVEEFQVRKDLRVQPKMAAAHWVLPQKEERVLKPTWGRGFRASLF